MKRWMSAGLFGLFLTVFIRRVDPDFGWHLEAGRYFLQHGIPRHDVFTYTAASFPWIDHEWLSDVMVAGLQAVGGFGLVAAVLAAVWSAAVVLGVRAVVRRPGWQVAWPVYALGFAAVAADAVARANAWTALGLAVVLWATWHGRADARDSGWAGDRRRWWLVVVFGLWANLHGGFVVGLVALGVAAVRDRRWWPVVVWSLVATCVNPYGAEVYVEIWRTMSDAQLHATIGEWEPLRVGAVNGFFITLYLFVVLAERWRYEFVLPTMLLASAVSSQRQFPLFVIATLGLMTEGFMRLVQLLHLERGWRAWVLPVLMTVLAVGLAIKIAVNPGNDWPVRGLEALRERPCAGRLLADYNFGGLVIWQLPGTKVYIDGRMPSWRGDDGHGQEVSYLMNYARVVDDAAFARAELDWYGVKCVLWDKQRGRLIKQLLAEGWRVDVKDERAVLLRRN